MHSVGLIELSDLAHVNPRLKLHQLTFDLLKPVEQRLVLEPKPLRRHLPTAVELVEKIDVALDARSFVRHAGKQHLIVHDGLI